MLNLISIEDGLRHAQHYRDDGEQRPDVPLQDASSAGAASRGCVLAVRRLLNRCAEASRRADSDADDVLCSVRMRRRSMQAKTEGRGNGIKTLIMNMSEVADALSRPAVGCGRVQHGGIKRRWAWPRGLGRGAQNPRVLFFVFVRPALIVETGLTSLLFRQHRQHRIAIPALHNRRRCRSCPPNSSALSSAPRAATKKMCVNGSLSIARPTPRFPSALALSFPVLPLVRVERPISWLRRLQKERTSTTAATPPPCPHPPRRRTRRP